MALLSMASMMKHAKANHYAIPAFNVWDLQSMYALQLAAEQEDAPVIIAGADMGTSIGSTSSEYWASLAMTCSRGSSAPMAVHLDHGRSFEAAMSSIRLGFTSVMIDASTLSFADNAAITRKVVDAAHAVGVTVEAELGHVGQGADEMTEELAAKVLTKPDEAVRFVQETGVDALAVSVGTLHGVYRFEPKIRWDLLDELVAKVPAYLVIHGGSGTPGLEKVARVGVTKINIATEIITSCVERLRKEATKPVFEAFQGIQKGTVEAEKEAMVSRIRCFGANGKGRDLLRSI